MRRSLLPFLAVLALSCGSSSGGGTPGTPDEDTGAGGGLDSRNTADVTPGDDTASGTDTSSTLGEYPPGPYGTKTGDILADFEMTGYLNLDPSQVTTTAEYKTIKLSDVRAAAKVPYLFIHNVGFF